jgi:peptidylprolyl isomerase
MKLALVLLALSFSALAQTPAPAPAKPATQHSAAGTAAKSASPIPRVPGIPKTLYALKYIDLKIGTGELPPLYRYYTVNYTGYLPDGTKFDSTTDPAFNHAKPFTFPYGGHRVIPGWDTGFEGMRVGGKRRLYVPYQLGYGLAGSPPKIPAKTNLVFDVELVSISDKPPAPPANAAPRPTPPGRMGGMGTPPPASAPATAPPATPPATPPPAAGPATPPPTTAPAAPATPQAPTTTTPAKPPTN